MIEWMPRPARAGDRLLNAWSGGAAHGIALVYHPGTPFPPVQWDSLDNSARDHGMQLITYARPGYSGSTRSRDRSVADAAADTAAVLDELGVGEFVTLGHSGGGPHALACAALLESRCMAAVSVAGLAPFDPDGFDWTAGMADENREELTTALKGEDALRPYLTEQLVHYSAVRGDQVAASLAGLVTDLDRAALTDELADVMAKGLRVAAADGINGWIDDDLAFAKPWGFDLAEIGVPVAIWHGQQDRMVPFAHGAWLHSHISTSKPRLRADEGHVSLLTSRLGNIVDDLLELAAAGTA